MAYGLCNYGLAELQILPKVSLITFIAGLVIIINSAGWGSATANAFLRAYGGSMYSAQFSIIVQGSINPDIKGLKGYKI
jgi:hypothetical protein